VTWQTLFNSAADHIAYVWHTPCSASSTAPSEESQHNSLPSCTPWNMAPVCIAAWHWTG